MVTTYKEYILHHQVFIFLQTIWLMFRGWKYNVKTFKRGSLPDLIIPWALINSFSFPPSLCLLSFFSFLFYPSTLLNFLTTIDFIISHILGTNYQIVFKYNQLFVALNGSIRHNSRSYNRIHARNKISPSFILFSAG